MRILITGGTGMLGSAILRKTDFSRHTVDAPTRTDLNLQNEKEVERFFSQNRPDAIIHCAAKVGGIQANINHPTEYLTDNIRMDLNLLTTASSVDVPNLIYIGSSCMYPKNFNIPISENFLGTGSLEETNENYALAKLVGTQTVKLIANTKKLNWKTLILSNMYGPGDHFELERSHLIAAIIQKVTFAKDSGLDEIQMWGDGTARREFTYVEDVAKFLMAEIGNLEKFPDVMNLGVGNDFMVSEYYDLVMKLSDYQGKLVPDLSKPVGMSRKLMDSSLANSLGWSSETSLEDGLRETLKWYLSESRKKLD